MGRTDHSMRSPTPETTIAFQSPNACNLCHADKDAAWSEDWVRKWYPGEYQGPVMERASLLDAARKGDWKRLPQMLEKIARPKENTVYKASLVRLLRGCQDESKWPALLAALADKSPLVRSSAASALAGHLNGETIRGLLAATRDPSRLVRIRAAMALAPIPTAQLEDSQDRESLERAVEEFKTAMKARPDDWAGYGNLGTFYMDQRDFQKAVECFETATRLEPRMVGPMVNASLAYSNLQENDKAESSLRRAWRWNPTTRPRSSTLASCWPRSVARRRPRTPCAALKADPRMAAAAFNLGVLCGKERIGEALKWCRKAYELQPDSAKYAAHLGLLPAPVANPTRRSKSFATLSTGTSPIWTPACCWAIFSKARATSAKRRPSTAGPWPCLACRRQSKTNYRRRSVVSPSRRRSRSGDRGLKVSTTPFQGQSNACLLPNGTWLRRGSSAGCRRRTGRTCRAIVAAASLKPNCRLTLPSMKATLFMP